MFMKFMIALNIALWTAVLVLALIMLWGTPQFWYAIAGGAFVGGTLLLKKV